MSDLRQVASSILLAFGNYANNDNHQGVMGIGKFLWNTKYQVDKFLSISQEFANAACSIAGKGVGEESIPLGSAIVQAGNSINTGLMALAIEIKDCMSAPFSPNAEEYGLIEGEVCGRGGCKGVIQKSSSDLACSCHIAPPCQACIEEREFCPECDWDISEEK